MKPFAPIVFYIRDAFSLTPEDFQLLITHFLKPKAFHQQAFAPGTISNKQLLYQKPFKEDKHKNLWRQWPFTPGSF